MHPLKACVLGSIGFAHPGLGMRIAVPKNCQEICDMDRQRGLIMNATSQVMVTLSADLLKQLRKEAREQHVPLRWLVAGLVCDTLETGRRLQDAGQPAFAGR
jgi:hypothetical protein